jgi:hypothetical protein
MCLGILEPIRKEVIEMEYELTKRTTYNIKLADADLVKYFVNEPHPGDTSEAADQDRDMRTEAFDALVKIVMDRSVEGSMGVITAYDDIFCETEVMFDEGYTCQVQMGLKDSYKYWCVHYEVDIDEELT